MLKAAEIAKTSSCHGEHREIASRAIYRKLDVTTRRGAVDRARELNLLWSWVDWEILPHGRLLGSGRRPSSRGRPG